MGLLYIFAAMILFIGLLTIAGHWRFLRIRRDRKGKGFAREHFVAAFRDTGIPEEIPAAMYAYYRSQKGYAAFSFLPDDQYPQVLSDDAADLEDEALALIKSLGMAMLPECILREWGDIYPK
jgi:hypothetical protein